MKGYKKLDVQKRDLLKINSTEGKGEFFDFLTEAYIFSNYFRILDPYFPEKFNIFILNFFKLFLQKQEDFLNPNIVDFNSKIYFNELINFISKYETIEPFIYFNIKNIKFYENCSGIKISFTDPDTKNDINEELNEIFEDFIKMLKESKKFIIKKEEDSFSQKFIENNNVKEVLENETNSELSENKIFLFKKNLNKKKFKESIKILENNYLKNPLDFKMKSNILDEDSLKEISKFLFNNGAFIFFVWQILFNFDKINKTHFTQEFQKNTTSFIYNFTENFKNNLDNEKKTHNFLTIQDIIKEEVKKFRKKLESDDNQEVKEKQLKKKKILNEIDGGYIKYENMLVYPRFTLNIFDNSFKIQITDEITEDEILKDLSQQCFDILKSYLKKTDIIQLENFKIKTTNIYFIKTPFPFSKFVLGTPILGFIFNERPISLHFTILKKTL